MKGNSMEKTEYEILLDACILAGKLMMENGAEMHRVEDTMNRILESKQGEGAGVSFVLPTGIFVTTSDGEQINMKRIQKRRSNLAKLADVNQLSRLFSANQIDVYELYSSLREINSDAMQYPVWMKYVAAAFVSAFMMLIFEGSLFDFPITMLLGTIGFGIHYYASKKLNVKFIAEFIASFSIGILTICLQRKGFIVDFETVIIGSIMLMVPGIPIMNSIRDFLVGNTISGTVFMVEALFIAIMIGSGIMASLQVMSGVLL
ncbi:threonine/serine exporter family protein [Erysipelothrix rhusiopathiae]|nr:threonine/serine exporter family protein [Erysipelothrix rhusiopathiae]